MMSLMRLIRYGIPVITFVLLGLGGLETGGGATFTGRADRTEPSSFDAVLTAHGGTGLSAVRETRVILSRFTWTGPESFFERKIDISISGRRFVRRSADPFGLRERIEVFDGRERFIAKSKCLQCGERAGEESLPSDARRLADVQTSNRTTGLLPLLVEFAEPGTNVSEEGVDAAGLEKFTITSRSGRFVVYADRAHLIRRVDAGSSVLLFGDMREVAGLTLPFVEKMRFHGRVVFEIYFSSVEVNPPFPEDYFDPGSVNQ